MVIFSTRGAKSGKVRKQPLMRVEHDGGYLMVGSQGGAPTNPAWVANLRAHPDQVTVQDGPEPWDGVARELTGEEKAQWWERAVAVFPDYADYQKKTDRRDPRLPGHTRRLSAPRGRPTRGPRGPAGRLSAAVAPASDSASSSALACGLGISSSAINATTAQPTMYNGST